MTLSGNTILELPTALMLTCTREQETKKQGLDLTELRLYEMENFIFGSFIRIFGEYLEDFW